MKLLAIITLALAVASTSAISHIKVTCHSVKYSQRMYTSSDCTGDGNMVAGFNPGECANTPALLSHGNSAKFAWNATTKKFTETYYSEADCKGTATVSDPVELDKCDGSYKITAATQVVDYHLADEKCDGLSLYYDSGECSDGTKITCSSDDKKFDYQLWEGASCSGDPDILNAKDLETGKCLAIEDISGAGSFSVLSSFAIMAIVMIFM
jgi:hypothetical protein